MHENIVFISPYEELGKLFNSVVAINGVGIETYSGDLNIGLSHALNAKRMGKKVFISRGGTAKLLQEKTDFPIVELKVTGYDLLRVLNKYTDGNKKVAIIGYDNVINGSKAICDILNIDAIYLPMEDENEVDKFVEDAKAMAVDIVVGDTLACRTAKRYGLGYELIKSGRESILNAYEEALNVCDAIFKEREKRERYKTILNTINEGIVVTDENGIIRNCNPVAARTLGTDQERILFKSAKEVIPNTRIMDVIESEKAELGDIQIINESAIATSRVPIIVEDQVKGVVVSFKDVTEIQSLEKKIRVQLSKKGLLAKKTFDDIVYKSRIMKDAIEYAKTFAQVEPTVLITGESGTGKEVFAQAIHNGSQRKNNPFVAINCAAIPSNLLESELFGYVEGSFTGASKGGKKGLFELAHGGTVFLDEIGEMPIHIQARILRVLQEREIMKLGDDGVIPIDVRIIAATNRNLKNEVEKNNFREDLYYRINVLNIHIPPLRERKDDILVLAEHFNAHFSQQFSKKYDPLNDQMKDYLMAQEWHGNVRELINVMTKINLISQDNYLSAIAKSLVLPQSDDLETIERENYLSGTLREIEERIVRKVLEDEGYNKSKTASRLGITRTTLNNKLSNN